MSWAVITGHTGLGQKLKSDFKVLGVGGGRVRSDLGSIRKGGFLAILWYRGKRLGLYSASTVCRV